MDNTREIARLDRIARLLDARFSVLGIRFGWDAIAGVVPVVGDLAAALPSVLIIHHAWRMGVPRPTLARMAANSGLDFAFGSVPVIGGLFDVWFKANLRNVALIRAHLDRQP